MKHIWTVFKFELSNYLENKSYMISTAIIAIILVAVILFLPNVVDLGISSEDATEQTEENSSNQEDDEDEESDSSDEEEYHYVIYDKSGEFLSGADSEEILNQASSEDGIKWETVDSEEEVKQLVEKEEADAGFVINSLTDYDYYVYNKEMYDSSAFIIESMLTAAYQEKYCIEHNLDPEEIMSLLNVEINYTENILGKDAQQSYWYCYALVIIVFMLIIFYGIMIATTVTTEKSNRSIELLITSTKSSNLLFGKVLAGTVASFLQVAIILGLALGSYKISENAWGHALDMLLKIKPEVLVTFALFGITGFIFYAFAYGAMGALVSKTEDLNKSASGVQMVIMIVYFVVLFQMYNVDGIVMKVASFLPVSSYSAMFIRVAMGEVALWEIIVSYLILVASTVGMGMIGSKIYRMGTLRYGNPIKISAALKSLSRKEES